MADLGIRIIEADEWRGWGVEDGAPSEVARRRITGGART